MSRRFEALQKTGGMWEQFGFGLLSDRPRPPVMEETPSRSPRRGERLGLLRTATEDILPPATEGPQGVVLHPVEGLAEEAHKLAQHLAAGASESGIRHGQPVRTVMMVSSVHGEGTSTMATHLALSLSLRGRSEVLLVDGNLRSPSLHTLFQVKDGQGFVDLLRDTTTIRDTIRRSQMPGLYLMTAGIEGGDPPSVLEDQAVEERLHLLSGHFGHVILDAPPVHVSADALAFASKVDGIVLVIRAEATRWEVVQRAREQLEKAGGRILGTVLNRRRYVIPKRLYKRL